MKGKLSLLMALMMICTVFTFNADAEEISVGDTVLFGHYEQDGNTGNGKEPISWIILDVQDGKALLLSEKALDAKPYNEERVTWETCTLRKWLNGEFLDAAFSAEEKKAIARTRLVNSDNPTYGTEGGNDTDDRIFLLSLDEIQKYYTLQDVPGNEFIFGASDKLICVGTEQAVANGLYTYTITAEDIAGLNEALGPEYPQELAGTTGCWWWLRSPGFNSNFAAHVSDYGNVRSLGNAVYDAEDGVRPALWISLDLIP